MRCIGHLLSFAQFLPAQTGRSTGRSGSTWDRSIGVDGVVNQSGLSTSERTSQRGRRTLQKLTIRYRPPAGRPSAAPGHVVARLRPCDQAAPKGGVRPEAERDFVAEFIENRSQIRSGNTEHPAQCRAQVPSAQTGRVHRDSIERFG